MSKVWGRGRKKADSARNDVVLVGDAVTMTTGGSGASVEDKRYPYG